MPWNYTKGSYRSLLIQAWFRYEIEVGVVNRHKQTRTNLTGSDRVHLAHLHLVHSLHFQRWASLSFKMEQHMECSVCCIRQRVPVPPTNPDAVRFCVAMLPSRCQHCCNCMVHKCLDDECIDRSCDDCTAGRIHAATMHFLYGHQLAR